MKLSGLNIPNNGKRVYKEDWDTHFESLSEEITNRQTDIFGHGVTSGGSITVLSAGVIRLAETIAYNIDGQRVYIPQTELTVPEGISTLVVRHKFNVSYSEPDFTQSSREYYENSFETAFVQTVETTDVPLYQLQRTGNAVTVLQDLRIWQALQNRNIANGSITNDKLSSSIKIGELTNLRNRLLTAIPSEALDLITAVNKIDEWLQTHTDNVNNPHNVKLSQLTNDSGGVLDASNRKIVNLTNGTVSTDAINKAQLDSAISTLKGLPPSTLDTLAKLATAINNDPSFTTTINNALASKSDTSHNHNASYSQLGHGHMIGEVNSLQSLLNGKSNIEHTHNEYLTSANVTNTYFLWAGETKTIRKSGGHWIYYRDGWSSLLETLIGLTQGDRIHCSSNGLGIWLNGNKLFGNNGDYTATGNYYYCGGAIHGTIANYCIIIEVM